MPFDYYHRLSRKDQATYRQSDALWQVVVPDAAALAPLVADLRESLASEGRAATQSAAADLVGELLEQLRTPSVRVKVLSHRPEIAGGELHGLYETEEGVQAVVSVWMRTAAQGRVVAFKTFLRTLLHEVVHHLDYDYFRLADSFHTHGFLRRESSLVRQLLAESPARSTAALPRAKPDATTKPAAAATPGAAAMPRSAGTPAPERGPRSTRPARAAEAQLELPW